METILSAKHGNMKDKSNTTNVGKLNMHKIKQKLQELKLQNQSKSNEDLNCILNQIMEKLDENDPSMQKIQVLHDKMIDRIVTKKGQLPEKLFMARNSILTDLAEIPHLNTIRNFFITIWLCIFVNVAVTDLVKRGQITFGSHQLLAALNNFHMAVFTWICMFTSTIIVYYAFTFWGTVRVNLISKTQSFILKLWDTMWLTLFGIYCFSFFYLSIKAIIDNSLQIMVSMALIGETIRLFMKTYAFIRSNTPRALKYKLHDEDKILCPKLSKFLYFSFAPTSIYRDSYPRTPYVRWNYVVLYGTELIGAFLCMHFIQEYILESSFEGYNLKKITWQDTVLLMSRNAIPCFLYWLCFIFGVFHATQNFYAEVLRFADRLFYKDWWNLTAPEKLYSGGLSVAVYDWVSIYVYKDMYDTVLPKNRIAAQTMELVLALVFHEFAYTIPYRFNYILMTIYSTFGIPIQYFLSSKNYFIANIFFLYTFMQGIGILRTGITLEYYVRLSCPVENVTILSYFIPRTFTCNLYEESY